MSTNSALADSCDGRGGGGFDCNICLDSVQDPVITRCGHLYCSSCIYKWLSIQTVSSKNELHRQCPVCKAEVSETTLIPIYGRNQKVKPSKLKAPHLGIIVPRRAIAREMDSPRPEVTDNLHTARERMLDSGTGPFGETLYARVFGNAITNVYSYPNFYDLSGIRSPRVRRHVMQADKSLDRVSFFMLCCILICLLSF